MPYIKKERREAIDRKEKPICAGEINYAIITQILKPTFVHYQRDRLLIGKKVKLPLVQIAEILNEYIKKEKSYQRFNDCVGAVYSSLMEFIQSNPYYLVKDNMMQLYNIIANVFLPAYYQREIVNYEQIKIQENGDIDWYENED